MPRKQAAKAQKVAPKPSKGSGKAEPEEVTEETKDKPIITKKLALALRERFKDIRKEELSASSEDEGEEEETEKQGNTKEPKNESAVTKVKVGEKRPAPDNSQSKQIKEASSKPPQKKAKVEQKKAEAEEKDEEEDEEEDWGEDDEEMDEEEEAALIRELEAESMEEDDDEDEEDDEDGFVSLEERRNRRYAPAALDSGRGVVYLGHIPHGFFEREMKAYFSQFGTVTRLRLSRSKRTGRSKGYAFIEFKHEEVAKIVAEAMHGYLLFGRVLVCKQIPLAKCHPTLWKGANRKMRLVPTKGIEIRRHNRPKKPEQYKQSVRRLLSTERNKRKKLKDLGIEYDFPGYEIQRKKKGQHTKFD